MKLNKLWASVLALMALASCGRDLEPSVNMPTPKQPAAEYQLVRMDIKATQDDNALRVGYGVSDDEDGALTGLALAEKNVNLRIAVKQGVNGTPVVDTYSFTKVGRASFTFSDNIKVPVKQGDEPYYMAAVLVSEGTKDTPDYLEYAVVDHAKSPTLVTFTKNKNNKLLLPNAENKIYPNIPYRSQWQQVEMNAVGAEGTVAKHTSIKLKPVGTLLRFRIHNTTATSKDVYGLFFNEVSFANATDINFLKTDVDGFPECYPHSIISLAYTLPAKITLTPNQKSNWYYMWVKSYNYTKEIRPLPTTVQYSQANNSGWIETPIFKTRKTLSEGSMNVTFKIRDGVDAELEDLDDAGDLETADQIYDWPGTVLSRLSTGVVNTTENGFVSVADDNVNVRDASVGYFTFADAVQKFKIPVKIAVNGVNKKYSLLTVGEMKSIFPARLDPVTSIPVRFKGAHDIKNVLERRITINGETRDYLADFRAIGSQRVTYAIRFKDTSNNKYRTAFKYTLEGDDSNRFVRVRARLLGNTSAEMDDITQDSFWSDPSKYDDRIFPFYGDPAYRIMAPNLWDYNVTGVFWTATARTSDHVYKLYLTNNWEKYGHVDADNINKVLAPTAPIFLFERK